MLIVTKLSFTKEEDEQFVGGHGGLSRCFNSSCYSFQSFYLLEKEKKKNKTLRTTCT